MPQDQDDIKGADAMKQASTPGPLSASRVGTNSGHGHAWKRPDGVKMRCGGPRICAECAKDAALVADVVFTGKQSLAPTAPVEALGGTLHPATANLVDRFAAELKSKLAKAEAKYGYRNDWLKPDWKDELIESLAEHVQKGDPRDVAAYCAFAWHHDWSVSSSAQGAKVWNQEGIEDLISDAIGDSLDMDWSARDGAKAVIRALQSEGLLLNGDSISALEAVRKITDPRSVYSSDDAARRAAFKVAEDVLSPAEQKSQAARCSCRGADDMCPCQNAADRQTIKDRSNA